MVLLFLIVNVNKEAYLYLIGFIFFNVLTDIVYYYGRVKKLKKGKRIRYIGQSIFNVIIYGTFLFCNAFNSSYNYATIPLILNFFFNLYNNCSCHDDVSLEGGYRCDCEVFWSDLSDIDLCPIPYIYVKAE